MNAPVRAFPKALAAIEARKAFHPAQVAAALRVRPSDTDPEFAAFLKKALP
jgi:hypothetical protein